MLRLRESRHQRQNVHRRRDPLGQVAARQGGSPRPGFDGGRRLERRRTEWVRLGHLGPRAPAAQSW